jgi:GntR family transcriptional regulator, transcriptional repressor for pyruvate dehydrogenase complex
MNDSATPRLSLAGEQLRRWALEVAPDELLGSEDSVVLRLGCSRSTLRQAARLLEREGVLRVRRGPSGGYFAARPDATTIGRAVTAYLEMLEIDTNDMTLIASALWVEAMRKAAMVEPERRETLAARLRKLVEAIDDQSPFRQVLDLELLTQNEIFELSRSSYIKLIFDINLEFASRNLTLADGRGESAADPDFVRDWRQAKLLELGAIAQGSRELAAISARYSRKVWQRKVGVRISELASLSRNEATYHDSTVLDGSRPASQAD